MCINLCQFLVLLTMEAIYCIFILFMHGFESITLCDVPKAQLILAHCIKIKRKYYFIHITDTLTCIYRSICSSQNIESVSTKVKRCKITIILNKKGLSLHWKNIGCLVEKSHRTVLKSTPDVYSWLVASKSHKCSQRLHHICTLYALAVKVKFECAYWR